MATTSAHDFETTLSQWDMFDFNLTTDNGNGKSIMDISYWLELRKHPIHRAATFINDNCLFILSGIGVPFNLLSFFVLRRIQPVNSAILIMLVLSLIDSLRLIIECSNRVAELYRVSYMDIGCSLIMTVRYLVQFYPIWLVVLLTLERVVAVCFPLKAAALCTISNARRVMVFLFIVDAFICIVHTFSYEIVPRASGYGCYVVSEYQPMMEEWLILDGIAFVIIPLILLCYGNLSIIIKLRTSREITNSSDGSTLEQESRRQNRSVTIMLLAVCITTTICLVPNIVQNFTDLLGWERAYTGDINIDSLKELAKRMIMLLTYTNNAVNFFLYVLSGSRFRTELRKMVLSWLAF